MRPTQQQLDALRQEVQALQAVAFGSVQPDATPSGDDGPMATLDRALLVRVRALEHSCTVRAFSFSKGSVTI